MPSNRMAGSTFAVTSGALTAVGAETVYDTTVTVTYCILGEHFAYAADADAVTPVVDSNGDKAFNSLDTNEGCYFVWCLDSAASIAFVVQGEIRQLNGDTGANPPFEGEALPILPSIPSDLCPFAIQLIKNGSTGTPWLFGTDNWNQTGIADLITDIFNMPDRPPQLIAA